MPSIRTVILSCAAAAALSWICCRHHQSSAADPVTQPGKVVLSEGFEKGLVWYAWPADRSKGEADLADARQGEASLRFGEGPKPVIYTYIKAEDSQVYAVSVWLKGQKLAGRLGLNLNYNREGGGNGSAGRQSIPAPMPDAGGKWTEIEATIETPPGTALIQLGVDLTRLEGTVWIDDVVVRDLGGLPRPQNLVAAMGTETPKVAEDQGAFVFSDNAEHRASASPDMPTMVAFRAISRRDGQRLVLELPAGIELVGGIRFLTISAPEKMARDGRGMVRYAVTQGRESGWFRLFWRTSLAPGTEATARYWAEWDGGRQEPVALPLEIVRIPRTRPPRDLITYLSVPCDLGAVWPDYADLSALGFNTVDVWPYTRDGADWAIRQLDAVSTKASENGITVGAWPGEWWWEEAPRDDPDARAALIDGKRIDKVCPSYRGKHFAELVAHGRFLADRGVLLHVFDPEIYREGATLCFCGRCREAFERFWTEEHPGVAFVEPEVFEKDPTRHPVHHAAWEAFKAGQYAGMFSDYAREVRSHLRERDPDARLKMTAYTTYHKDWDSFHGYDDFRDSPVYVRTLEDPIRFAEVFDTIGPMIYPDIYARGGPYDMLWPWKDVSSWRRLIGDRARIAPLLGAGFPCEPYQADLSPQMVKWQILEALASGAGGFGIWGVCPLDARDMRAISEAVATVLPVEDILATGAPATELRAVNGRVFVKGVRGARGTVVLVSEYSDRTITDEIECATDEAQTVFEPPEMCPVGAVSPQAPGFSVKLGDERTKLFYIGRE